MCGSAWKASVDRKLEVPNQNCSDKEEGELSWEAQGNMGYSVTKPVTECWAIGEMLASEREEKTDCVFACGRARRGVVHEECRKLLCKGRERRTHNGWDEKE